MDADDRAVLELDELDEPGGAEDLALAIAAEVVFVGRDIGVAVQRAGLGLVQADTRDLGLAVGDLRNVDVGDDDRVQAGDLLGDEDAVLEAAVGELQAGRDVADREHVRDVRAQALVDEDPAALHGDALLLEPHAACIRAAAHGDEEDVGVEGLAILEGDEHAVLVLRCGCEAHAEREVDAALAVGALEGLGAGDVLVRDEIGEGLDDGDLGAEGAPDARELDADDPAAEHDDPLRDVVEVQSLIGGHDAAVDVEARERSRVGAGREDDIGARVLLAVHLDGVRGDEAPGALDIRDVAALHQTLKALVEPADDAIAVLVHLDHVDAVQRGVHAEVGALTGAVGDLCRVEQCLGRDAAAVQAGAAELVLVDEDDGHAKLARAERAGVAAAAATEDDEVCTGHGRLRSAVVREVVGPILPQLSGRSERRCAPKPRCRPSGDSRRRPCR